MPLNLYVNKIPVDRDGIIITPEIASWRYYSHTATMRVLMHLCFAALGSESRSVSVSVRSLCRHLDISYKECRTAFRHLTEEGIISVEGNRSNSKVTIQQWHSLRHCLEPYMAHQGAQTRAHNEGTQTADSQYQTTATTQAEGVPRGADKGAGKNMAHQGAQTRAHNEGTQTADSQHQTPTSTQAEGAPRGADKGAGNKKKKISPSPLSPTPPITVTSTEKEKTKKKKKGDFSQKFYDEVMEKFNSAFEGKGMPRVTRMSEQRCLAVHNFIADFSVEDIDRLISIAASTPALYDGRQGKRMVFDSLFNPKNYMGIMEGAWQPVTRTQGPRRDDATAQKEDAQTLWNETKRQIKENVNGQHYNTLFLPMQLESYDTKTKRILLRVPDMKIYEYIESHYADLMFKVLSNTFGKGFQLNYRIPNREPPKKNTAEQQLAALSARCPEQQQGNSPTAQDISYIQQLLQR